MRRLLLIPILVILSGCATVQPGNDPVVVNAERTTILAVDTFDTLIRIEKMNRPYLLTVNPQIKVYADKLRKNSQSWLRSARVMTESYKENRDAQHKANLNTALALLVTATAESQHYIAQSNTTHL